MSLAGKLARRHPLAWTRAFDRSSPAVRSPPSRSRSGARYPRLRVRTYDPRCTLRDRSGEQTDLAATENWGPSIVITLGRMW